MKLSLQDIQSVFDKFEKNQNSNHITCKNKTHQKTGFKGAFFQG